jgi:hypothetical protein
MVYNILDYWFLGLRPSSSILRNTKFQKLDLFLFLGTGVGGMCGACVRACACVRVSQSQSQFHITTDGRSVSMSWCRACSGTCD